MAGAIIGALRVVLGADSAALTTELDGARGKLAQFGEAMGKTGLAIGAAMAAIGVGLAISVKDTVEKLDQLGKSSQKMGIPVEQLAGLELAAQLSSVSLESLGKSMSKLGQAMTNAAAKPLSDAANAFKAVGVSATTSTGALRPTNDVLLDVADRFAGAKDGAAKTALAMALFGKAGADLIPLLNQGRDGILHMTEEAAKFGLVVGKDVTSAASEFNDTLVKLGKVKEGIIVQLTARLLPAMQNLGDIMLRAAQNTAAMKEVGDGLAVVLKGVATVTVILGSAIATAFENLKATVTAIKQVASGDIKGAWETVSGSVKDTGKAIADTGSLITEIWKGTHDVLVWAGDGAGDAKKKLTDLNFGALAGKTALLSFLDGVQKSTAGLAAEAQTVGLAAGAKERLKAVLEAYTVASANHLTVSDALRAKISAVADAAENQALKLKGAQLAWENSEPLIKYQDELANTEIAMRKFGATGEQIARAQEAVAQKFGVSWQNVGSNIAGTAGALSQLSATFAKENKSMGVASKAFGIAQAIINTQIAITKALATFGPTPPGFVAMGLAVAQGAASIATISQQKFATGGFGVVPGGVGGADSVPVSFLAQPGERVKIEPNRYGSGGRDSGGGMAPIIFTLSAPAVIGRDGINSLIKQINAVLADSGKNWGMTPR